MKYIKSILSLASIGMLFYIIFNQKEQIKILQQSKLNTDSLVQVIDSLKSEIFVKEIEVGRYEVIFDRAEAEMTPECKEELEEIRKTVE
jgi:hypothetical protein